MKNRKSGILLHISSLPSQFGIGDLGPFAYRFVDFLTEMKQGFWQILPVTPTDQAYANSPYCSVSAFASNPLFISPELLMRDGLLEKEDMAPLPDFPKNKVDYGKVTTYKGHLFNLAYERFKKTTKKHAYEKFCQENAYWLDNYALFVALKSHFHGKVWNEWSYEIRNRKKEALQSLQSQVLDRIEYEKFLQFVFFLQWSSLKLYCNERSVQIIGDMPIYVQYDSADLWASPEIFKLNDEKTPYAVSGVPPDYFSETGQLWGNPVYHWEALKERGFEWWRLRIGHDLKFFDLVRIDHFRGFIGYWEVPGGETTAINGRWVEAPGENFFKVLLKRFPYLPVIAEDLGVITPDVREVMRRFDFPGMKVLLFAFGEDSTNPYLPHNAVRNCVIYTGTHDNNTVRGWFEKEATPEDKKRLFRYLGREVPPEVIHLEFIRMAMMSVANTAIIPMQDLLGLGEEARMNRPAQIQGNWQWRLLPEQLTSESSKALLDMTEDYGRA